MRLLPGDAWHFSPFFLSLVLALCGTAAAHDGESDRAFFRVGAAAVEVTPPLFGQGENPAACAGASNFTGPHVFNLEEPYTDTNGNGRYDAGEPFLDCPTPRANGGTRPPMAAGMASTWAAATATTGNRARNSIRSGRARS